MLKKGKGRYYISIEKKKGKKYKRYLINVDHNIAGDTQYPFKDGEYVEIIMEKDRLILRKREQDEEKGRAVERVTNE